MELRNVNSESLIKPCGIIVLVGAACKAISLFTFIRLCFEAGNDRAAFYLIRDILCIVGFVIIGLAVFTEKHHLFRLGLFTCAASFLFETYLPLSWTASNLDLYDDISDLKYVLPGENVGYFVVCITALAGFIIMGLHFSQKSVRPNTDLGKVAFYLLVANIVITLIYMVWFMNSQYVDLKTYLTNYIPGSTALAVIGIAGAAMLPLAFPNEVPRVPAQQVSVSTVTMQTQSNAQTVAASGEANIKSNDNVTVELLRKYKQLLDMGIITQDEFNSKKADLLK